MSHEHAGAHSDQEDYTFNASALGLGGVLHHGRRKTVIPSLASVALPPTGGEGSALVENYDRNGISFTRAESRVAGYPIRDTYFTTYSDILVTNLSVFDRFTVAVMHLTVASSRDTRHDETQFSLHAMYRGVAIDGDEVVPDLDIDLCVNSDYDRLAGELAGEVEPDLAAVDEKKKRLLAGIGRREPIRSSLIRSLQIRPRDGNYDVEQRKGNVLRVPGFATIHFGELLVKPGRRRVNLLRFEFSGRIEADHLEAVPAARLEALESHADGGGTLTVGSGDGNGAPVWPKS